VDDIAIYSASHILQEKWSIYLYDSNNNLITPIPTTITDTVNWAYGDEKHDAAYSVLWQTANLGTNVARLLQTEDTTIDIRPNYQYTFSAKAKVPANGGSPSLKFCLFVTKNSGETRWVESNAVSFIDNGSNWANYSYPFISGNSDEKVRLGFTVTGAGSVLLDAVMFAEANPADTDGKDFITGENCEWRLKTSDDFIQNDSSVPDAVRTSIVDFGLRETVQTVDAVTTTSQARKWAKGYFGVNAQPVVSHKLELLNPEVEIKPDGHVKLLGVPAPSAFPVKVSYSLGGDNIISASVELSTERPSFELLLAKVAKK
jgi:hypothetical protein